MVAIGRSDARHYPLAVRRMSRHRPRTLGRAGAMKTQATAGHAAVSLPDRNDGARRSARERGQWASTRRARRSKRRRCRAWASKLGMTLARHVPRVYGDGGAEEVAARERSPGRRERLFVVSKVYPQQCRPQSADLCPRAQSQRLGTDRARSLSPALARPHSAAETVDAFGAAARRRQDPRAGAFQFRHVGHARAACRCPRAVALRDQSGPLSTWETRDRMGAPAVMREHGIPLMAYSRRWARCAPRSAQPGGDREGPRNDTRRYLRRCVGSMRSLMSSPSRVRAISSMFARTATRVVAVMLDRATLDALDAAFRRLPRPTPLAVI